MSKLAIYPGSFDPFHLGHFSILEGAANLFDEIHVLVANNASKNAKFSLSDRVAITYYSIYDRKDRPLIDGAKIKVIAFAGITAQYAKEHKANAIVRGIRNGTDLDYEFNRVEAYNRRVAPEVKTIYLTPEARRLDTSSSLVRDFLNTGEYECASEYLDPKALDFIMNIKKNK